ncbi:MULTISPECIES: heme o synthase [Bacillus]|uniref:heme o synthase n=1 Tax=Bacillus TaxID=1386 RepID=UPI0003F8EBE7|nr:MULTISPECIES: heme o synthase [Bacillus]QHZ46400.1 protoheme IX farnesyltransferase [Bacillus sp. NSP9.1]
MISLKNYISLVKPGIIISNSIAAFGGFWIACISSEKALAGGAFFMAMLSAMAGTALVMAAGTVYNNYFDRHIDAKMERTKSRASAAGRLSPRSILAYGTLLGVAGLTLLCTLNVLTALLGFTAFILYAVIYTVWFKRSSVWSTFVGSFPGAAPPLMGYCAAVGHVDMTALILYAIMFLWQPPHFWAIGITRKEEYRAAGVPLLPVVKGNHMTKVSMIRYIILLVPVTLLLYFYVGLDRLSPLYFISALILGFIWIYKSCQGFKAENDIKWSKSMFQYSLVYFCLLFSIMIVDTFMMAFIFRG